MISLAQLKTIKTQVDEPVTLTMWYFVRVGSEQYSNNTGDITMKLRLMKLLFAALAFEIMNIINIINLCSKRWLNEDILECPPVI